MNYKKNHIMILTILIGILLLTPPTLTAASITGTVVDLHTGKPLPFVNVFLANTTLGDATNSDGQYELDKISYGNYQLVISRIGYEIEIIPITIHTAQNIVQNIKLKIKPIQGDELTVEANDAIEWRKNLKKFQREFIGISKNAKCVKITNPEYLSFSTDSSNGEFIAVAGRPLKVINNALGYDIEIVLTEFRWADKSGHFTYYPHYSEIVSKDDEEKAKWQKARQDVFHGSLRDFLSQIYFEKWKEKAFEFNMFEAYKVGSVVRRRKHKPIYPRDLEIHEHSVFMDSKKLIYNGHLCSLHKPSNEVSYIELISGELEFDSLGNVINWRSFKVAGDWGRDRIADALPVDYIYNE